MSHCDLIFTKFFTNDQETKSLHEQLEDDLWKLAKLIERNFSNGGVVVELEDDGTADNAKPLAVACIVANELKRRGFCVAIEQESNKHYLKVRIQEQEMLLKLKVPIDE